MGRPLTTFFRAFFLIQIERCRSHAPSVAPSVATVPSPGLCMVWCVIDASGWWLVGYTVHIHNWMGGLECS